MKKRTIKDYAGLIGLGVIFLWGSAIFPWFDFWSSEHPIGKAIGFIGLLLVNAIGIAVLFYTNHIEEELKELKERFNHLHDEMLFHKKQRELFSIIDRNNST